MLHIPSPDCGEKSLLPKEKAYIFWMNSKNLHSPFTDCGENHSYQRTYSMTTRRLGSVPVEWVVMLSMSCRAAWMTWRS